MERIEQAQIILAGEVSREGAAVIVNAVCPGPIGAHREAVAAEISQLEARVHGVIERIAAVGAEVNERVLIVDPLRSRPESAVNSRGAAHVEPIDSVEVRSFRTRVIESDDRVI